MLADEVNGLDPVRTELEDLADEQHEQDLRAEKWPAPSFAPVAGQPSGRPVVQSGVEAHPASSVTPARPGRAAGVTGRPDGSCGCGCGMPAPSTTAAPHPGGAANPRPLEGRKP